MKWFRAHGWIACLLAPLIALAHAQGELGGAREAYYSFDAHLSNGVAGRSPWQTPALPSFTPGLVGQALSMMPGWHAVTTDREPLMRLGEGDSSFVISFWFKPETSKSYQIILAQARQNPSARRWWIGLNPSARQLDFYLQPAGNVPKHQAYGPSNVQFGVWNHAFAWYDQGHFGLSTAPISAASHPTPMPSMEVGPLATGESLPLSLGGRWEDAPSRQCLLALDELVFLESSDPGEWRERLFQLGRSGKAGASFVRGAAASRAPIPSQRGERRIELKLNPGDFADRHGTNDVARLRRLAANVGCDGVYPDIIPALTRLRPQYMRLINRFVDRQWEGKPVPVAGGTPGAWAYDFSYAAHIGRQARKVGAAPYLVFGETTPRLLQEDPAVVGANAWEKKPAQALPRSNDYAAFVAAALDALLLENDPPIYVEVGNEFDSPDNWYANLPYEAKFDLYMRLYRIVLTGVNRYEARHPGGPRVKVGGPSPTAFSFSRGIAVWKTPPFNFVERFLKDCAAEGLRLDFVSYHAYLNLNPLHQETGARSFPSFDETLQRLRTWRDRYAPRAELVLSEYGFDSQTGKPNAKHNATHVGASQTAELLMRMLEAGVNLGMALSARRPPTLPCDWPTLFSPRGEPLPLYYTQVWFATLPGRRLKLPAMPEDSTVRAIAASDGQNGALILWNTRWMHAGDNYSTGHSEASPAMVHLEFAQEGHPGSVTTSHIDADSRQADLRLVTTNELALLDQGRELGPWADWPSKSLSLVRSNGVWRLPPLPMPAESIRVVRWQTE